MNINLKKVIYHLHLSETNFNLIMLALKTCYDFYKDSDGNKHLANAMKDLSEKINALDKET